MLHDVKSLRISRFDDPRLKSGYYLLRLLCAIKPGAVELSDAHAEQGDEQGGWGLQHVAGVRPAETNPYPPGVFVRAFRWDAAPAFS